MVAEKEELGRECIQRHHGVSQPEEKKQGIKKNGPES
jgi:hypothetical protein